MSDNWVVQNLENALEVWNGKLSEIWQLITQSPQDFKGGAIWAVIADIHGALQAIGYALLVLFFVVGVVKTCGSFVEVKKPEHALKLFVRFVLAKALITYGMELMLALLDIIQGVVSSIMNAAGFGAPSSTVLPAEIVTAVEDCGFFESIPLWAVTLIGGLLIWVLSFVMILSVYGRFLRCICMLRWPPSPCLLLPGNPARMWARAFSKATPPSVWREPSSCWPVSSSPCSPVPRLLLTRTLRRPRWCGAILAKLPLICLFWWAASRCPTMWYGK